MTGGGGNAKKNPEITGSSKTPSAAGLATIASKSNHDGNRTKEAYPWLDVGRPIPAGCQIPDSGGIGGRRQWQKFSSPHVPLGDLQGSAPPTRRDRTPEPRASGAVFARAPAIPRSTSLDMLSHSVMFSGTQGAKPPSQAPKRGRTWRRAKDRASNSLGVGRGGDGDETNKTISFRDATLVAWVNSVLFFEHEDDDEPHGKTLFR